MTNAEAIGILAIVVETANGRCFITDEVISEAYGMAIKALKAQEWIPCNPLELPKDKKLWVTHDAFGYRYVTRLFWDMTGWNDNVSDVVAYIPYVEPEPYREE